MEAVFLKVLNMSITASWIVLAVMAARLLLKKAPKWITVLMWGLVGIRLVCPISLESAFSLIPSAEPVPSSIIYANTPVIHSGISQVNDLVNPIISESLAPAVGAHVNPMQTVTFIASIIWLVGMAGMLLYTAVSYLRIRRNVREAIPSQENIWLCDHVDTPFILGVLRPRIFLPSAMGEQDQKFVIAHEQAHLKRHDHFWKPLGFVLLTIYWFNPLLWIAYILLCRDIELACDEKVIRELGAENKASYSNALINCSVPRKMLAACPLAFGEGSVKGRVKSVLNYKKPGFWIILVAVISCVAVAVCFLPNPTHASDPDTPTVSQPVNYYTLDASNGLDVYVWEMAEHSYSFGVLPHSETPRHWLSSELMSLRGADVNEMRQILASYDLGEKDIHIIPWQNPYSSYIAGPWIVGEDGTPAEAMEEYILSVKELLFSDDPSISDPANSFMVFDVDGDGKEELCTLTFSPPKSSLTSGMQIIRFCATEPGAEQPKYVSVYWGDYYYLSLVKCEDGVVRVMAIDQETPRRTHMFDISITDGVVRLTKKGQEIGAYIQPENHDMFIYTPKPSDADGEGVFTMSAAEVDANGVVLKRCEITLEITKKGGKISRSGMEFTIFECAVSFSGINDPFLTHLLTCSHFDIDTAWLFGGLGYIPAKNDSDSIVLYMDGEQKNCLIEINQNDRFFVASTDPDFDPAAVYKSLSEKLSDRLTYS